MINICCNIFIPIFVFFLFYVSSILPVSMRTRYQLTCSKRLAANTPKKKNRQSYFGKHAGRTALLYLIETGPSC